jgi:MFS family permease
VKGEIGPERCDERAARDLWVLSVAFFFVFAGAGAQQVYLLEYLGQVNPWSSVARGGILAATYWSFMVFRVWNVYLLRRLADHLAILFGALTYVLFVAAVYFLPHSYPALFGAAMLWGWGAAAFWSASSTRILDVTDRRRRYGLSAGTLYAGTHGGFLVGTLLLGALGKAWGAPTVFYAALNATAIGVFVLAWLPRRDIRREAPAWRTLTDMALSPKGASVAFLLLTSSLAFGLLLGAFSEHVEERFGLAWGGMIAGAFSLARLVLGFAGTTLSDTLGRHRVFFAAFALASAGLAASVAWEHVAALVLASFALGALGGIVPATATALIGDSADRARRPLAYGALFVWRDMGVGVAIVLGSILRVVHGGSEGTFLVFAIIFAACAVPALLLGRRAGDRL